MATRKATSGKDLLTPREFATLLGLESASSIYELIRSGQIKSVMSGSGMIRPRYKIPRSEVAKGKKMLAESRVMPPTAYARRKAKASKSKPTPTPKKDSKAKPKKAKAKTRTRPAKPAPAPADVASNASQDS